jgi:hypothetical protein
VPLTTGGWEHGTGADHRGGDKLPAPEDVPMSSFQHECDLLTSDF